MRIVQPTLAISGALALAVPSSAQNMSFGANNFYHSPIATAIAGNLFILNNISLTDARPAIVVSHPMDAVKEQSANLYATKLAEAGFVTVSLDLPFWGGSEGEPRNVVSPEPYAEAFSAAFVSVDRERIGAVGICGSGGFLISAAKIDPRIKAVAAASMHDMGAVNRHGLQHSQFLAARKRVMASAAQQRWVEVDGGATQYTSGTLEVLTANSTDIERGTTFTAPRGASSRPRAQRGI
ncbi:hypothetical protein AN3774.2 [Aspergillus nidulans FGSC A4]|uniref:Alpha/beta superfamily hydrolase, putative (AFU_orthologue AFUA_2G16580) n=1 Tax=Emericella nidulans (strain FGSC A4 / ATCC 38163 / CBS 112.46 / NRRL 194 / M139) TaxID=227321 RepID=Q5B6Q6_EMENI|nr:hypothetical protein [Aspergillus nidulans FGSC A4]EAA59982.1 hypothetical protein AN3774.2 [Aspergillus nidulans FGSC A4]CBF75415.1 TPA: alpha/beta superfamily hydrolase, putative (AFU_orthologue; AFUA_2G16580) [Aspergillus nidulans FGSC A4]|eukprot:XP_661378.1 hypothetical protein AN3774.2 [Aspergillus nidulans FGSC A4]